MSSMTSKLRRWNPIQRASDARYFAATKRGELQELRDEINSDDVKRQKEALKKVIANMTVGRDVSMLYADVVKMCHTPNMELKKLVYLYIINNSRQQPEKALLAVNTLVTDCQHENPIVRALAIRTMLCIRVDLVLEYASEPLKRGLQDTNPYVRKTACLGVLKLYAAKPRFVQEHQFIEMLEARLFDQAPLVVANTVVALSEIHAMSLANEGVSAVQVRLTEDAITQLLNALPECTEWGQIVILDYIAEHYNPEDARQVEQLLDRVCPRLSHSNVSIVLSSVRLIMKYLEFASDEMKLNYYKKLAPRIVTLLNSEPELQYVVLRNIEVIIQKYPSLVARDVKAFFCKYSDPGYVKKEKLSILLKLLSEKNVQLILEELREYCTEGDVEFVHRSVKAVGFCAIKVEVCAERAVEILMELLGSGSEVVINDSIIALKDILRKYAGRFQHAIPAVCQHIEIVTDPDAKQALIWIIGEHAERIPNPDQVLTQFIDVFLEEPVPVQLQILVATVKVFLKFPNTNEPLLTRVLKLCQTESDNADLRDRAYFYWRLLSNDHMVDKMHSIVLGRKPPLITNEHTLPRPLLDELLRNLNTLAAAYHRMPSSFPVFKHMDLDDSDDDDDDDGEVIVINSDAEPVQRGSHAGDFSRANEAAAAAAAHFTQPSAQPLHYEQPAPQPTPKSADPFDIFDFGTPSTTTSNSVMSSPPQQQPLYTSPAPIVQQSVPIQQQTFPFTQQQPVAQTPTPGAAPQFGGQSLPPADGPIISLLTSDRCHGLTARGGFGRQANGQLFMVFHLANESATPITTMSVHVDRNIFGIASAEASPQLQIPIPFMPGSTSRAVIRLTTGGQRSAEYQQIRLAFACNLGTGFALVDFPFWLSFTAAGQAAAERKAFIAQWKLIPGTNEIKQIVPTPPGRSTTATALQTVLVAHGLYPVMQRNTEDQDNLYFSASAFSEEVVLVEVVIHRKAGQPFSVECASKSANRVYAEHSHRAIGSLIQGIVQ